MISVLDHSIASSYRQLLVFSGREDTLHHDKMPRTKGRSHKHKKSASMGWKIRRHGRETNSSAVAPNTANGAQHMKLKSCLKKDSDHNSLRSHESSSSSRRNCDSTKSGGSRGSHSSLIKDEPSCTSSSRSSASSQSSRVAGSHPESHHSGSAPTLIEKGVRFNEIHVREFERIVGDNPSCSSGPPIGYVGTVLIALLRLAPC